MRKNHARIAMTVAALLAVLAIAPVSAEEDKVIKYDFSDVDKVFKATAKETMITEDLDPTVLYKVLQTGQIVVVNDKPNNPDIPWLTTEGILINAPPETVCNMIMDIDKYSEFVPQVDKAWKEKVTDQVDRVYYDLAIQILFVKVKIPYSVYHYNRPPNRIDWTLASGDFAVNLGAYEVADVPGEPNRSMLFYTSYALPRNDTVQSLFDRIPSLDMMINLSSGTILLKAMKSRAEGLYKKDGGDPSAPKGKLDFLTVASQNKQTVANLARRGKIVVLEDGKPMYYTGVVVINKPKAEVYKSLTDFEGIAAINKNYDIEILERGDNTERVKAHTVIPLVVDFDSDYYMKYKFEPDDRFEWVGEPGGDLEGVAGSWELFELSPDKTLVFYRNTSDLASNGIMMRQLLKIEPTFEQAIQASQTAIVVDDNKKFAEASPAERAEMAKKAAED